MRDVASGKLRAVLDLPVKRILNQVANQVAVQSDILRLRRGIIPGAQYVVSIVRSGPIRFRFFDDAPEILKDFPLRIHQAQDGRLERNAAHVPEPCHANALEVEFQASGETRAKFRDREEATLVRKCWGRRPGAVRIPTTLQNDAGLRSEPPLSLPSAIGTIPQARLTAAPPLLPPQVFVRS